MDRAFLADFRGTVQDAARGLTAISDRVAGRPLAAGKWSRKQILGHLIDSACNNHSRFVRAMSTDDLVFEGYDQDAWVRVQHYAGRPWDELIGLWEAYNLHLGFVMERADRDTLDRPRTRHSLDTIAFVVVEQGRPATLSDLMRDYVEHMKHHLRQCLTPAE